jgi:Ca2+-binding EF-hand superfamily protein
LLDREEVRQLLQMCSGTSTVSDSELDTAMKELDADGSGEVDLEEFLLYFKHNQNKVRVLRAYTIEVVSGSV